VLARRGMRPPKGIGSNEQSKRLEWSRRPSFNGKTPVVRVFDLSAFRLRVPRSEVPSKGVRNQAEPGGVTHPLSVGLSRDGELTDAWHRLGMALESVLVENHELFARQRRDSLSQQPREGTCMMPRPYSANELYEMLDELVKNDEARTHLSVYDEELRAGRGNLLDGSQCSELAFDSFSNFKAIGWSILAEHGWPSYLQVSKMPDAEEQLKITRAGTTFINLGRRLIRREPEPWGWPFQDEDFDIDDRASVLKLMKLWDDRSPNNSLYTIAERE
jgi:hypothetical protein